MTNKELAVEYRKSLKQKLIDKDEFERLEMFDENVEEAFLAGFEAGKDMADADLATIAYMQGAERYKTKWHNLIKAPEDLPAKRQHILCYTSDPWCHNQKGLKNVKHCDVEMGTYMGDGEWYMGCYHTCVPPKAWCEIPKFEE